MPDLTKAANNGQQNSNLDEDRPELSWDINIPAIVLTNTALEPGARLLFGIIRGLNRCNPGVKARNAYFAELLGFDVSSVKRWLSSLRQAGLIRVVLKKNKYGTQRLIYPSDVLALVKKTSTAAHRRATPGSPVNHPRFTGEPQNTIVEYSKENKRERGVKTAKCPLAPDDRASLAAQMGGIPLDAIIQEMEDYLAAHGLPGYVDWKAGIRNWHRRTQTFGKPTTAAKKASGDPNPDQLLLNEANRRFGHLFSTGRWILGHNYIEEQRGDTIARIHPGEDGFKEILAKALRSKDCDIRREHAGSVRSSNHTATV